MTTTRQIERLWRAMDFGRMASYLLQMRPESTGRLELELSRPVPAAAMALIRLDELNQSYTDTYKQLLQTVLAEQEADGGWGDPLTTALCVRALLCGRGQGLAIERGIAYLAGLQKTDGLWPRIPLRRTSADPFVSAFILFHLANAPGFSAAVRLSDAVAALQAQEHSLDADAAQIWRLVSMRLRLGRVSIERPMVLS